MTTNDPEWQREYFKRWYANPENKAKTRARIRKNNETKREFLREELKKHKVVCQQCGEDRYPALQFHHRDPSQKSRGIARMVRDGYALDKVLDEIAKCDVLCANCHLCLHAEA